jgi:PPOX class probable F420-dependent enzyme
MRLRKSISQLLMRERVCRVATVGRGGFPHVVPVCQVLADGKVYFGTDKGSQKARNLEANPHMAVLIDVYTEEWSLLTGVMVQGTAKLIRRGPIFRRIRTLLYDKYPQYPDDAALKESDSTIVEMTPTRVSSWHVDK